MVMNIPRLLLCLFFIEVGQLFAGPAFAYILQADKFAKSKADFVKKINESGRDIIVIDYSFDGSRHGAWQTKELAAMKQSNNQRKVLAYLSIGEAEDYRSYWKKEWLTAKKPEFLLDENPKWKGNYRVRYWSKRWQSVIFEYLNTIVQQGFDGVYLDIVDGYEFFEKGKDYCINPETLRPYREDMKRLVTEIARRAKSTAPRFLIFQQNALALLSDNVYMQMLDGVGVEDLFTDGRRPNNAREIKENLRGIIKVQARGLPIMVVEYARQSQLQALVRESAAANRLDVLLTNRELTSLGTFVKPKDLQKNKGVQEGKSGTRRRAVNVSVP